MSKDTTRIVLLATASVIAFFVADHVYRVSVVPRLPGWQSVPLGWWWLVMGPLFVVVAAAGWLCTSVPRVPFYGLAIVLPPTLIEAGRGLFTGAPVGHDTWVSDSAYWITAGLRVALCIALVGVVHVATRRIKAEKMSGA